MTKASQSREEILFEGLTEDEILSLASGEIDALVITGGPIVFRAGSASILGEFKRDADRLVIELAHIDGGGEGVLLSLSKLAHRYARQRAIKSIEWIVHAVNCAKPNLKLRRILERRGFAIRDLPRSGSAYFLVEMIQTIDERERSIARRESGKAEPRAGWSEASKELRRIGEDVLVWPEFSNEEDSELKW